MLNMEVPARRDGISQLRIRRENTFFNNSRKSSCFVADFAIFHFNQLYYSGP